MSQPVMNDGEGRAQPSSQSGMQVWMTCALFIVVPTLVILIIKYLFGA